MVSNSILMVHYPTLRLDMTACVCNSQILSDAIPLIHHAWALNGNSNYRVQHGGWDMAMFKIISRCGIRVESVLCWVFESQPVFLDRGFESCHADHFASCALSMYVHMCTLSMYVCMHVHICKKSKDKMAFHSILSAILRDNCLSTPKFIKVLLQMLYSILFKCTKCKIESY
jgi:hypothetical protein